MLTGRVRMYKEEGLRGYMKGNGINCARIFPYSAIQFTSYGAFKNVRARGELKGS